MIEGGGEGEGEGDEGEGERGRGRKEGEEAERPLAFIDLPPPHTNPTSKQGAVLISKH